MSTDNDSENHEGAQIAIENLQKARRSFDALYAYIEDAKHPLCGHERFDYVDGSQALYRALEELEFIEMRTREGAEKCQKQRQRRAAERKVDEQSEQPQPAA